jgi:hypothetical protein
MEVLYVVAGIALGAVVVGALLLPAFRRRNERRRWERGVSALELGLTTRDEVDFLLREEDEEGGALLWTKIRGWRPQNVQNPQQVGN